MADFDPGPLAALQRLSVQRADAGDVGEDDEHPLQQLQRQAGNAAVSAAVQREDEAEGGARSSVLDIVGRGGGRPLDGGTRSDMEARFGADFSDVRVHDGASAQRSATEVGARAYTTGHEVVLGEGVSLGSADGQHTLAHELTHVLQQRSGPVDGTSSGDGVSVSDPSDRFEQEAESTAHAVMTGAGAAAAGAAPAAAGAAAGVQREELDDDASTQLRSIQRQDGVDDEDQVPT